jgi:hypothetical protein
VESGDTGVNDDATTSLPWKINMELFKIDWQVAGRRWPPTWAPSTAWRWPATTRCRLDGGSPASTYVQMLEANSLADITDALEHLCQRRLTRSQWIRTWTARPPGRMPKVGGKIIAFRWPSARRTTPKVLIARQDWLDKLGLKMPTTLDE